MTNNRQVTVYGVVATAITAAIAVSLLRGVWLDEGYTLWFTGHDVGFARALHDRWMRDAHPPLYYAWVWLWRPVAGDAISTLRLVNLGALLLPALTWWAACSVPEKDARFHRLFAMLVVSSPFFVLYAAELRSYFLMYIWAAALVAQTKLLLEAGDTPPARLIAVTVGTALLLFNVHYLGGLIAGVVLALLVLDGVIRRRWRVAVWLVATGVTGVVTVAGTAAYYLAHAAPGTGHDIDMASAIKAIAGFLALAIVSAPVAMVVALRAALPPRAAVWRERFVVGAVAATMLLLVGFLAYNVAQHNLLARYVIGLVPVVLGVIAAFAARGCERWRWGEPAVAVAALVGILASAAYGLWNRRWETNAPAIAKIVSDCPTTRVLAISAIPFMQASSPVHGIPGVRDAFRLTYRSAAARYGFTPEVIEKTDGRRTMRTACPTILWVEHRFFAPMYDDRTIIQAAGLTSPVDIKKRVEGKGRLLLVLASANDGAGRSGGPRR